MSLKLAIGGAAGRMGRALCRAILAGGDLALVGGCEREEGQDLGRLGGAEPLGLLTTANPALAARDAEVWIDFSTPAALAASLPALPAQTRALVIGVTGIDAAGEAAIAEVARTRAVVRSGNFSLGVNLLLGLAQQAASRLGPEWDIEILEAHHRRKLDSPSGTALMLGEAVAAGRGASLEALRLPPRDGQEGARPEGGVGFAVLRGGGVIGEHAVMFAAEREILTLSHQALDRGLFADGALAAARWAASQPAGLYSMQDVLGLAKAAK